MGKNLHELLKVGFSQLKLFQIVGNDSLWVWQVATPILMHGQETKKEIEWAQTKYEVATVDQGYQVYVAV